MEFEENLIMVFLCEASIASFIDYTCVNSLDTASWNIAIKK